MEQSSIENYIKKYAHIEGSKTLIFACLAIFNDKKAEFVKTAIKTILNSNKDCTKIDLNELSEMLIHRESVCLLKRDKLEDNKYELYTIRILKKVIRFYKQNNL